MAKFELTTLDGIPEALQKEYRAVDLADGKRVFHLEVETAKGQKLHDPDKLMATVERLRPVEDALQKFGKITPEIAAANVAKIAELTSELESAKASGKGNVDARIKDVTDQLNAQWGAKLEASEKRSAGRLSDVVRLRRDDAAKAAARAAGFDPKFEKFIASELAAQIEVVEHEQAANDSERFSTLVKGPNGGPRRVPDKDHGDRLMTVLERAQEMTKDPTFKDYVHVEPAPASKNKPSSPREPRAPANDNRQSPSETFNPRRSLAAAQGLEL